MKRIRINFSGTNEEVPFSNIHLVNSYIHRCLGENNEWHDIHSNYCVSCLCGGVINDEGNALNFKKGAYIIVSSTEETFLGKLLLGLFENKYLGYGMEFLNISHISEKFFNGWNHFTTLPNSGILLKNYEGKKRYSFLTIEDENFQENLKYYLKNKINKINPDLDLSNFDINIPNHPSHKVKKIIYKKRKNGKDIFISNFASRCHISIFTNKEVAELLYCIGIGQSTGSGFGTIYKTENHHFYK